MKPKLTKQQIKTLVLVGVGLVLIGFLIFIQQTNINKNPLPPTEQQAKRAGQDVEEIKKQMEAPNSIDQVDFKFDKLKIPARQMRQFKEVLYRQFPLVREYSIDGEIDFKETKKSNLVLKQYKFNLKTNTKNIYSITLSYQSTYDLFLQIKEGDKQIYISPYS